MMISKFPVRPVATIACLAGLMAGCQTVPHTYTQPRIEAVNPDQRATHHFWQRDGHPGLMRWRDSEYYQLLPTACADKVAGQPVTISLQNGKVIQGSCILQFKPYAPVTAR